MVSTQRYGGGHLPVGSLCVVEVWFDSDDATAVDSHSTQYMFILPPTQPAKTQLGQVGMQWHLQTNISKCRTLLTAQPDPDPP